MRMTKDRNGTETRYERPDKNTMRLTIDDSETGIIVTATATLPDKILQLSGSEAEEILPAWIERIYGCMLDILPGNMWGTEGWLRQQTKK